MTKKKICVWCLAPIKKGEEAVSVKKGVWMHDYCYDSFREGLGGMDVERIMAEAFPNARSEA